MNLIRTLANPCRGIFMPVLAVFAGICLIACEKADSVPMRPALQEIDAPVAATVNGEAIYVSDVEVEAVARGFVSAGEAFESDDPQFRLVLDQLIDQKLIAQEAILRGLENDPAAQRRLAMARERILGNLLFESLVASEVTDSRIDEIYAEQLALQQSNDEVSIAHILLETEAEARAIHERIINGESFEALAVSHSRDASTKLMHGSLGWVSPNNEPDPLPKIIAITETGDVADPYQTDAGWHILKVKDRRTRRPQSRDEMRPQIATFLTLREINRILRGLRSGATIREGKGGERIVPTAPYTLPNATSPAVEDPAIAGEPL